MTVVGSLSEKKSKSWGDTAGHNLASALTGELDKLGFRFDGFDEETHAASWRKDMFAGYFFLLTLLPQRPEKRNHVGFVSSLFIESVRHAEAFQQMRPWDCDSSGRNEVPGATSAVTIFGVALPWLIVSWVPRTGTFLDAFKRWECVPRSELSACAADLAYFIRNQGMSLWEYFENPLKIAQTLLQLPEFPGRVKGGGPGSSDAPLFAAIILKDLGQSEHAIRVLDAEERKISAEFHRGERDEYSLQTRRCVLAKCRDWTPVEQSMR